MWLATRSGPKPTYLNCCTFALEFCRPDLTALPVQQLPQQVLVVHVSRGGSHQVDQVALGIDADVGLHAEVPMVAFLGLVHLGIARLISVVSSSGFTDTPPKEMGASPFTSANIVTLVNAACAAAPAACS